MGVAAKDAAIVAVVSATVIVAVDNVVVAAVVVIGVAVVDVVADAAPNLRMNESKSSSALAFSSCIGKIMRTALSLNFF